MLRLAFRAAKAGWSEMKLLPLKTAVALGSAGLGQPPRPKQLWKAFGIVLPIGLLAWWAIPQATIVMSPSIDAWLVREAPGPPGTISSRSPCRTRSPDRSPLPSPNMPSASQENGSR